MIDHVAYEVVDLTDDTIDLFAELVGWAEFQADAEYQRKYMQGYEARWFTDGGETDVHLVKGLDVLFQKRLALEHLCVKGVGEDVYQALAESRLCVRNSGSGRIWLDVAGLSVEVHP